MRPFAAGSRIAIAWAVLGACILGAGCRSSGIDPSGRRLFARSPFAAPPEYQPLPPGARPWDNVELVINPARCVAPVGANVVLLGGVVGPDRYLRTNERVEWTLSPGSPGQLVDFGRGTWVDPLLGDFTWPHRNSGAWVVTSTSRRYLRLTQGTLTAGDDVMVMRGQSWVAVSSPVEGASYVTAFAPSVYGAQRQTAVIHWVDAEWRFPSPVIQPAGGRQKLTTTVFRHTDKSPRTRWIVRYDVVGGPPAGFGPDCAPGVQVFTNACGAATAELVQREPTAGTNQINIQVIRPAGIDGAGGKAVVIGSGSTTATWSAPGLAIRKTGPAVASVGATVSYQITVTNSGDLPADGVTVSDEVPAGFDVVRTNPPAAASPGRLEWRIDRLEARQSRLFEVDLHASRSGTIQTCAEVSSASGLRSRHCATTTVGAPTAGTVTPGAASLAVRIVGPTPATVAVGDQVTFEILIENRGTVAATGLWIRDSFDAGLEHVAARSPIKKPVPDLPPGQPPYPIKITFRAVQPGTWRHAVEVTGAGGLAARAESSVQVAPAAAGVPQLGAAAPGLGGRASVDVEKSCATSIADVGQTVLFTILVRNTGDVPLTKIAVVDSYDAALRPSRATEGYKLADRSVRWTIDSLPVGKIAKLEVVYRCEAAAAQVANHVAVTTAEGAEDKAEARLEVRTAGPSPLLPTQPTIGARPSLAIELTDWGDQIPVGRTVTYEIVVSNNSTQPDEDVVLEVDVPAQLQPIDAGIKGPTDVRHTVVGQTVRFDPVRAIRPTDRLRYQIEAKAIQPGKMQLRARVRSKHMTQELEAEEETEILGAS